MAILIAVMNLNSQELSTDVFPSEDEIFESYLLGEISYDQYLILKEFSGVKLDSSTIHLLDFIPNLSYFGFSGDSLTNFEQEQQSGFLKSTKPFSGKVQYRYSMYLDEAADSRYQNRFQINHDNKFKFDIKLNKEYSDRERFTYRQLAYIPKNSIINKILIGNFSQRLGLGSSIGYRGKLLDYSLQIDNESFLYPDFGGQNSFYAHINKSHYNLEVIQSVNRDENHSLNTSGIFLSKKMNSLKSGIIFSYNRLKNRQTELSINDYKSAISLDWKYRRGFTSFEITRQTGYESSSAMITEGKYNVKNGSVKYAGWYYDNNFLDFSGGSKYSSISNTLEIEEVNFSFSNKRSNQKGGLIISTMDLNPNFRWSNSILYASRNNDSLNFQFLTEFSHYLNKNTIISFDFLNNRKKRKIENDITRKQARIVFKHFTDKFYLRTYLAYNTKTAKNNYSSFFLNTRWQSQSFLEWDIWLNMGRFNLNSMSVDYWYAFLKNEFTFSSHIHGYMKASFRYNRSSSEQHRNSISFELNYLL
jgi:hypothetical protein